MAWLRVAGALLVLAFLAVILMPVQALALRRDWALADRLPKFWFKTGCRVIGLRVRVEGKVAPAPVLIASNHVSWLDIAAISSVLPVSFVAKSEVAGWPVVGFLARLQRTIFVDRKRRSATAAASAAIAGRVGKGHAIVLFAEGTTGDGNRILPFRSSLIGAAEAAGGEAAVVVQPLAVVYTALRGLPIGQAEKPLIAWYGDMDLAPHFARIVGIGAIDVVLSFGEPISFSAVTDRKQVARDCYEAVRRMAAKVEKKTPPSPGRSPSLFSGGGKSAKASAPSAGEPRAGEGMTSRIS